MSIQSLGWKPQQVLQRQQAIKHELDQVGATSSPRERSKYIIAKMNALEDASGSNDVLDMYLLGMSALNMQASKAWYTQRTIRGIYKKVESVLKVIEHDIRKGGLSFLHADYWRLRSRLLNRAGHQLASRWDLLIAERFTGSTPTDDLRRLNDQHGHAIRLCRVGRVKEGLAILIPLFNSSTLPPATRAAIGVQTLRASRLVGDHVTFARIFGELQSTAPSESVATALEWEKVLHDLSGEECTRALKKLIASRKLNLEYQIEFLLRCANLDTVKPLGKIPSFSNKRTRGTEDHKSVGVQFDAAECIQNLYDDQIPMDNKLRKIGRILERLRELPSFELELLLIRAIRLWCSRRSLKSFEDLLAEEFRSMLTSLPVDGPRF